MLVVGAAAGAGLTYVGARYGGLVNTGLCASGRTLTIGELTDLTDGLSSQGIRAKDSSLLAINDVNSFLSTSGCNLKFAITIDDYALDNSKALTALQSLAAAGAQVVVGPLNSGAAAYIKSYADSNKIVLISPSSTSVALAIPGDYLFRTAPNDRWQGQADARIAVDRGAKALIIVERHDAYGDALANATKTYFTLDGGAKVDVIPYDTSTTDFSVTLTTLANDFTTDNSTSGGYPNQVAIDAISFEEFGQMLQQANTQQPKLLNAKLPSAKTGWFGTDGEAQDSVIVNATYGNLVSKVVLPSTLYGYVNNTKTQALYTAFGSAYSGQICDAYCLGAYDDVWLAALATLQAGAYNGASIQAVMLTVAGSYFGVTGPNTLEASGDRVATVYGVWKVVTISGTQTWVPAGTWTSSSDSIAWTNPP